MTKVKDLNTRYVKYKKDVFFVCCLTFFYITNDNLIKYTYIFISMHFYQRLSYALKFDERFLVNAVIFEESLYSSKFHV